MIPADLRSYLRLAPPLKDLPKTPFWLSYDAEADVMYVNFQNPATEADDTELTDDDVLIRYSGESIVGLTIMNASQRS